MANRKIANYVSTHTLNKYIKRPEVDPITIRNVYRISRKISKLLFNMFKTEERTQHNIEATVNAYVSLITIYTIRVIYDLRKRKPYEKPVLDSIAYLRELRKIPPHLNMPSSFEWQHYLEHITPKKKELKRMMFTIPDDDYELD